MRKRKARQQPTPRVGICNHRLNYGSSQQLQKDNKMNRNTTSCAERKDIRMNPNKNVHAKGPKFGRVGNFPFTRRSFFSDASEFLTPHAGFIIHRQRCFWFASAHRPRYNDVWRNSPKAIAGITSELGYPKLNGMSFEAPASN
ncbi:MAG: hypothetical protein SPI72_04290 [Porphyromonas sp.]|nr:hypothetical protein [Porphyromonas sp.]